MTTIYVGNLPFSATEDQLRELFAQHGSVVTAEIVKDKFTERSRGFAFVEMATDEDARNAIAELNAYSIEGRKLTVNEARPKPERRAGGGYGGRGREPRW